MATVAELNVQKRIIVLNKSQNAFNRGEVEVTRLEAKAMDTKNFEANAKDRSSRGQGQRLRTQTQVFSKKKEVFKNFFQAKKVFKDFFIRRSLLEVTKKKVSAEFPQDF